MQNKRVIRKSGYGDYFAIDLVNDRGTIVETPIYLKKGEERKVKIRWDFSVFNSSGEHQQSTMEAGFIRYDGNNVELTYSPEVTMSGNSKYWWEATDFELTNKSMVHFKI